MLPIYKTVRQRAPATASSARHIAPPVEPLPWLRRRLTCLTFHLRRLALDLNPHAACCHRRLLPSPAGPSLTPVFSGIRAPPLSTSVDERLDLLNWVGTPSPLTVSSRQDSNNDRHSSDHAGTCNMKFAHYHYRQSLRTCHGKDGPSRREDCRLPPGWRDGPWFHAARAHMATALPCCLPRLRARGACAHFATPGGACHAYPRLTARAAQHLRTTCHTPTPTTPHLPTFPCTEDVACTLWPPCLSPPAGMPFSAAVPTTLRRFTLPPRHAAARKFAANARYATATCAYCRACPAAGHCLVCCLPTTYLPFRDTFHGTLAFGCTFHYPCLF